MNNFDLDSFITDCRAAIAAPSGQQAVHELVSRAVSDPGAVIRTVGEPSAGGVQTLHRSPELTILNFVWAPKMTLLPHNHKAWAVIGIYSGREDNIFWKRVPDSPQGQITAAGAKSLQDRDAVMLGIDIIHSVTNPIPRLTGAIHVYGGDFFNERRSEWDAETLDERPCNVDRLVRQFEEDNRRWFGSTGGTSL